MGGEREERKKGKIWELKIAGRFPRRLHMKCILTHQFFLMSKLTGLLFTSQKRIFPKSPRSMPRAAPCLAPGNRSPRVSPTSGLCVGTEQHSPACPRLGMASALGLLEASSASYTSVFQPWPGLYSRRSRERNAGTDKGTAGTAHNADRISPPVRGSPRSLP